MPGDGLRNLSAARRTVTSHEDPYYLGRGARPGAHMSARPAAVVLQQADTGGMTTASSRQLERSGPAIRRVLAAASPEECQLFEQEFAQAAQEAGRQCDVAPLEAVLDRWWKVAALRSNPLSEQEEQQLARARHGDFTGLLTPEGGNWRRL